MKRPILEAIVLFCISMFAFLLGLNNQEIIGFESRFYLFALEMWRHGISWFPTAYLKAYPDYPVTATLLIYGSANLLGGLSKFTAVFPSAIAAALTVAVTYLIGSLHSRRLGISAVCFLFLTMMFLKTARSIALDMYPTLATVCSFYLVYSAEVLQKPKRALWIYLFFFLGFVFRGPIGLVMPTGVVCAYYLLNRDYKKLIQTGIFAFLLLIACMLLLLALAYHTGGQAFMQDVLRMQIFGRIDSRYLPFYFYFTGSLTSYALSYPLAFIMLFMLFYQKEKKLAYPEEIKFLGYLFAWTLIILVGMSIPGDKKIRYVLPMVPAISLISGYLFVAPAKQKIFYWLGKSLSKIFLFFPAFFLLATEFVYFYAKHQVWVLEIYYVPLAIFFIVLQLIAFWFVYRDINGSRKYELKLLMLAALSFVIFYIGVVEPIAQFIERARDFIAAVEAQRLESHAQLVFYKAKPDGLPIKYLINTVEINHPIFIDKPESLVEFKTPAYFVAQESDFAKLPADVQTQFKIIGNDRMAHTRVIVFTNQKQ